MFVFLSCFLWGKPIANIVRAIFSRHTGITYQLSRLKFVYVRGRGCESIDPYIIGNFQFAIGVPIGIQSQNVHSDNSKL